MQQEPASTAPTPSARSFPPGTNIASEAQRQVPLDVGFPNAEPPEISLGIRVKLVALLVGTSFVIVGVLTSYFPARQISELRSELRDRAGMYGHLAAHQLRSAIAFGDRQTARDVLDALSKDHLVVGGAVYADNGTLLDSVGKLSELAQSARHGFDEAHTFYLPGRVLVTAPIKSLEGPRGTLIMELSTSSAIAARDHLVKVALGVGAAALALSTLLARWSAGSLASRVEGVARAALAVQRGDLDQHLALDGPRDEIGVLAHSFDAMVRRLRELIDHVHRTAREEKHRLEHLVRDRTQELGQRNIDLRCVLDNVDQGFITVDRDANVVGEQSRVVQTWLGEVVAGDCLWQSVDRVSHGMKARFDLAWSQLVEGDMPAEVSLAQMPHELSINARHLRFEYKPLGDDEDFERLLIVISDVTALVLRERSEREDRDVIELSSHILRDRVGFSEFFSEAQRLVERIEKNTTDVVSLKRDLHTLKGNAALFGLSHVSALCHAAESELELTGGTEVDCSPIGTQWQLMRSKVSLLLGEGHSHGLSVDEQDYEALLAQVRRGGDHALLSRMLEAWRLEPLRVRLERAADQLVTTASRLGKGEVRVVVECAQIYLARDELSAFWSVFAHVVRNAAVHGIEDPVERQLRGKQRVGAFALRAGVEDARLFVEIEDSGPGIDWDSVRARAVASHLPSATESDLQNALFTDGISTEANISEVAGRGVGLGAVRATCAAKRGAISVSSNLGKGTTFRFSWPTSELASLVLFDAEVRA